MRQWSLTVIAFLLATWCYQQHEHVQFNYEGSFWASIDKDLPRPFFKNNSYPELQRHVVFRYLPFTWDGYHMFAWMMKFFYWLGLALMVKDLKRVVAFGIVISVGDLILSNITYWWFFK